MKSRPSKQGPDASATPLFWDAVACLEVHSDSAEARHNASRHEWIFLPRLPYFTTWYRITVVLNRRSALPRPWHGTGTYRTVNTHRFFQYSKKRFHFCRVLYCTAVCYSSRWDCRTTLTWEAPSVATEACTLFEEL